MGSRRSLRVESLLGPRSRWSEGSMCTEYIPRYKYMHSSGRWMASSACHANISRWTIHNTDPFTWDTFWEAPVTVRAHNVYETSNFTSNQSPLPFRYTFIHYATQAGQIAAIERHAVLLILVRSIQGRESTCLVDRHLSPLQRFQATK